MPQPSAPVCYYSSQEFRTFKASRRMMMHMFSATTVQSRDRRSRFIVLPSRSRFRAKRPLLLRGLLGQCLPSDILLFPISQFSAVGHLDISINTRLMYLPVRHRAGSRSPKLSTSVTWRLLDSFYSSRISLFTSHPDPLRPQAYDACTISIPRRTDCPSSIICDFDYVCCGCSPGAHRRRC